MILRQRGASGAFILAILAFIMVGILAAAALRRTSGGNADRDTTVARLARAADALDAYAAETARLPCPADPTLDTGDEDAFGGTTNCNSATGTLPWRAIGLARSASFDAWGRKISYRVYDGATGLTQAGGASMVNCDTNEATPIDPVPANGLCPNTYNMTPAQFLAGKGLKVTDMGTLHSDAAYVLISHGASGMGGYTSTGARLDMPVGDERDNTLAAGNAATGFMIRAFSDPDTAVNTAPHFDDLLAYRSIVDLVKRANLPARNWPDNVLASVTFDRNTVKAALGGSSPGSDTGQATIAFTGVTVTAFTSGGNEDIGFSGSGGTDAIGGVAGGSNGLVSTGGEGLRLDLDENAARFAVTLKDFDSPEVAELEFWTVSGVTATIVTTVTRTSSTASGGGSTTTSFCVDVPAVTSNAAAVFNRVEIRPQVTSGGAASSFALAEIETCAAGVACATSFASSPAEECP